MRMPQGFSTVLLLSLCQSLAMSVTPMIMLIGSFIGADLAPSPALATLPLAMLVVGAALGTVPATLAMQRFGRRCVFICALLLAAIVLILLVETLILRKFWLYVLCIGCVGFFLVAFQQVRFAAMEAVAPHYGVTAASVVLLSGVIAAFIGPEIAVYGQYLFSVEYQGAFYMAAALLIFVAVVLIFYRNQTHTKPTREAQPRALIDIIQQPVFWLALASSSIGFAIMVYIMTATPISMHLHNGHSLLDTKWVIQSHIAAMFLPSLFVPSLIALCGLRLLMLMGLLAYLACIVIALLDSQLIHFWWSLVCLGIGWNFLFVAGTSLLPQCYSAGEGYHAQAFNDGVLFATQAIAALSAGWVLNLWGWQSLLLSCIPIMLLLPVIMWRVRVKRALS